MARKWNVRLQHAATPMRAVALSCGFLAAAATVVLAPPAHAAASDTATRVEARVTSDTAKTRYPIVLVHGLLGFDNLLGVDYFYDIPGKLAGAGAKVYVAQVSGTNTSEIRGEQLLQELKTIRAMEQNPTLKFNLIGHSQGSPTVRYVAAVAPDMVASVTSVGGANGGSKVADLLAKLPEGGIAQTLVVKAVGLLTGLIGFLSGKDPSQLPEVPLNALASLTTAGGAAFDAKFPQGRPAAGSSCDVKSGAAVVNNVRYYSWSGVSTGFNLFDPSDTALSTLGGLFFFGEANDGLLAVCTTRLGTHLGDYRQNHLDEVNQAFGNTYGSQFPYYEKKVPELFREQAARLKSAGL
ncbi:esterase/lipase family protein [Acidovorax cavernicola]|uniref:Triacylglycerol lipase n=1 Tax=Acidovorax cavernicola TaxID=1675792 RepID=A0A9X8GSP7_9BURK|nr:triacylglycerol lipase [Acidovorax cavernicola]RIX74779.1 triacylglycerol lipase [Acidovorax cavernicola]